MRNSHVTYLHLIFSSNTRILFLKRLAKRNRSCYKQSEYSLPYAFVMINIALNAFRPKIEKSFGCWVHILISMGPFYGCCMARFNHYKSIGRGVLWPSNTEHNVTSDPRISARIAIHISYRAVQIKKPWATFRPDKNPWKNRSFRGFLSGHFLSSWF